MSARRVELDYIAPARQPVWAGLGVLAFSLVVAAGLLSRHQTAQQELARLETESGLILPQRQPVKAMSKERLDEETKNAEAVVRRLTLPWASLIGTMEEAATREVAILQLQPDAEQRVLKVTAEARNRDAMFEYLRRLSASKGLAEVHLVSHQVQLEDPQHPIQFSVQAGMR
jgi:Tfp pilus assembly protein PilN